MLAVDTEANTYAALELAIASILFKLVLYGAKPGNETVESKQH